MEGILHSIADLVARADLLCPTALDGARASEQLDGWAPSLLLIANEEGRVITMDAFEPELHAEAAPLAVKLAAQLERNPTCTATAPARRRTVALKLADGSPPVIVGALMPRVSSGETPADPLLAASWVAGALAWAYTHKAEEARNLQARVDQLQAQLEALRDSHTDAVATAIQEREERLRQHEEHVQQLQTVMMMAADGIATVDEHGVIQSFNEAAGWIFGYAPDEVIGQSISLLIPASGPEKPDDVGSGLSAACEITSFGVGREVIGRRKDGTSFPLDLAVSEVCLGDRKIFTGIFRDITERKRAEEALRRLHVQNESILNSAGEGIIGLDAEGRLIFVNPAAARMLGWEVEDLIGKLLHDAVHHSKPDGCSLPADECPMFYHTAPCPSDPASGSYTFWRKDGTSFPVECTTTPIREDKGVAGMVVTFRDITERRHLEAQLRQAQKLESIGQLAAGIAHEINTPTQYIGDNTRFLQESFEELRNLLALCLSVREAASAGKVPPELDEIVAAVDQADVEYLFEEIPKAVTQSLEGVKRVARIVRSMKEFSHPNGENFQSVDLNHAIESTLTVSRNEWKYVAEAVTDLDPSLPLITCLPGDINQVVLNLIVNAAHAIGERIGDSGEEKGRIAMRTRLQADWVEIQVEDNGMGIPKEVQSRIFDPFFTTKPVGRGTGQGLAICHSVVTEKHHGTLTFVTEPGRGTTFIVRLPVCQKTTSNGENAHETRALRR